MICLTITVPGEPPRKVEVSPDVADRLRLLAERGEHGVYLPKLGGRDVLGELATLEVPFEAKSFPSRGTGAKKVWITVPTGFAVTDAQ